MVKLKRNVLSVGDIPKTCPIDLETSVLCTYDGYARMSEPVSLDYIEEIGSLNRSLVEPELERTSWFNYVSVIEKEQLCFDSFSENGNRAKDFSIQSAQNSFDLGDNLPFNNSDEWETGQISYAPLGFEVDDSAVSDLFNKLESDSNNEGQDNLEKGHVNLTSETTNNVDASDMATRLSKYEAGCKVTEHNILGVRMSPYYSVGSLPADEVPSGKDVDGYGRESSITSELDVEPDNILRPFPEMGRQSDTTMGVRDQIVGCKVDKSSKENLVHDSLNFILDEDPDGCDFGFRLDDDMVNALREDAEANCEVSDVECDVDFDDVYMSTQIHFGNVLDNLYEDQEEIWSLMTQEPSWGILDSDCSHIKPANFNQFTQKELEEDLYEPPLPLNEGARFKGSQNAKEQHFNADHNNIPEEDLRYTAIKIAQREHINPDADLGVTYLCSRKGAEFAQNTDSTFPIGQITLNHHCETQGNLYDGTPIRILVDTGATKNMLGMEYYKKNEALHEFPVYKIKPRKIMLGDAAVVKVNKIIVMNLMIGGHLFEFVACLMENFTEACDFIIGIKSLFEIEGNINMPHLKLNFKVRTAPIYATKTLRIIPNKEDFMLGHVSDLPLDFSYDKTSAICKMVQGDLCKPLSTLTLPIQRGKVPLQCVNKSSNKLINIQKGDIVGFVDLRSCGYFHLPRTSIKRYMFGSYHFLSENQTVDCLNHITDRINKAATTSRYPTKLDLEHKDIKPTKPPPEYDKTPWLEADDPRRFMTDEEILRKFVNLEEAFLTDQEKEQVYKTLLQYKSAFSLRDEIGLCPNLEVHLEIKDKTPFFLRPFPVKETDKEIVDKEMRKGCLLGIMKKGMSSYSSPIMLIPRKLGGIPRIVTDFRHLNTRLVRLNPSIPLVRDAIQILGASGAEVISVIDLRDAYHTLRLDKESQPFCGITPYYGSPTYIYQRLAMGLSVSPAIWMEFITKVLDDMPDRKHHLAIMDDCMIHSDHKSHLGHLVSLFKALQKNGLKISPKKCQLFRKKLVYMGHTIIIEEHGPCITALKSNVEPILKMDKPQNAADCRSFCGMVNFLAMYLPRLQELLIPIYKLTRKKVTFEWTEECQKNFDHIKELLMQPPVLTMPNKTGRFTLVSDTSKTACGATLYQFQKGKNRLVAYISKTLPEPAKRYSISELELCGLAVNILSLPVLRRVDFDVVVDHSALVHIAKGKKEPATLRLQKLLEVLKGFSFTVYFMKGKLMYVTDFLSRHPVDEGKNVNEIIPIAFHIKDYDHIDHVGLLKQICPNNDHICNKCKPNKTSSSNKEFFQALAKSLCTIMTRKQAADTGVKVPDIYPLKGEHRLPEHVPQEEQEQPKSTMIETAQIPESVPLPDIPGLDATLVNNPEQIPKFNEPLMRPMQPFQQPIQQHVQAPIQQHQIQIPIPQQIPQQHIPQPLQQPLNPALTRQFIEDRMPLIPLDSLPKDRDEEVTEDFLRQPTPEYFRKPTRLIQSINEDTIFRKHIPRQVELDKYLKILKKKVIHNYQLSITHQEIRAEYSKSPYFKDIYKYITTDMCSLTGKARQIFKLMCEDFIVIEDLLFKMTKNRNSPIPKLLLCIPETCIPTILYHYHDIYFAGHQGVLRMYNTLREKFYFPNMMDCIRKYIISCHCCQSRRDKTDELEATFARIPLDFKVMTEFSMDVKHMPPSKYGFRYILFCTCEHSGYVEGIPIKEIKSEVIADAIFNNICCRYGNIKTIIFDEARYFTSEIMEHLCKLLNITPKLISVQNHGSNRTERQIRTFNDMICKQLHEAGENWPIYVKGVCFAMNSYVKSSLGYSPHEIVYVQKPPDLLSLDIDYDTKGLKVSTREYLEYIKFKQKLMKQLLLERITLEKKSQQIRALRSHPDHETFRVGDLVFLFAPTASTLQVASRKLKQEWIGPLKIHAILDKTHFMVSDLSGRVLPMPMHERRLKKYHINMGKIDGTSLMTFDNIQDLLDSIKSSSSKGKDGVPISVLNSG